MNININKLTLIPLDVSLSICRLLHVEKIPDWADVISDFLSITRTREELSIVCPDSIIPDDIDDMKVESGWRAFKVKGQLDFSLTGILASIAEPLSNHLISIFAISTFDTDYVLVKEEDFQKAVKILSKDFIIEM